MEACWNDCECAASDTGCLYWKGQNVEFEQNVAGTWVQKYFIENASTGILVITLFIVWKRKKGMCITEEYVLNL